MWTDNLFTTHKRYRDDYHMSFSSQVSPGTFPTLTPLVNLPEGVSQLFVFNTQSGNTSNPFTPNHVLLNPSSSATLSSAKCNSDDNMFQYSPVLKKIPTHQSQSKHDQESVESKGRSLSYHSVNSLSSYANNINNNVNIEMPNMLLLPGGNPNLGFYTWVMQGTPTPILSQAPNKRNKKFKKTNFVESMSE